jgi:methyl-accepting chemotaxis protein
VIVDLDRLNQNTEQDFLRIGGQLGEFIETVNQISSELTTLADLISGDRGLGASQALTNALDHSMETRARYADSTAGLCSMREEAGRLKRTLSGYEGTATTFHTIAVLTRIETARLGRDNNGFGALADDVKALARSVQTTVEGALDSAAQLLPPIESAMQDILTIEEGQARDLPSVISGVSASLASFRDRQDKAHESSVRLGAGYEAISTAFKKLIVSIQFHDITRQQVEHVVDVLRRLCAESESDNGNPSRDRRGALAALALQSMQLADAGEKFAASVESVASSLDDIANRVLEMADESLTLSGLSEDEKDSFFLEMERGCTAILAALGDCAEAEAATWATGGSLAVTIGRMSESIRDIRAIEIQMQRLALNASIRAAHLGESGDALGVLAGTIKQRALESRQRSDCFAVAVGAMGDAASRLAGQGDSATASGGGGQNGYLEGMRTAVVDLHASSERSVAYVTQIAARSARLREDLSATRQSFSVGALFAEAVSRARETLKEIGETHRSGVSGDGTDVSDDDLAELARHYTMQAERDVHESLTRAAAGEAPVAAPAEASGPPPQPADELGDNVEFF